MLPPTTPVQEMFLPVTLVTSAMSMAFGADRGGRTARCSLYS